MSIVKNKKRKSTGRKAAINVRMGKIALSVGNPSLITSPGWMWVSLLDVAELATGHTPSRRHPEYWNGDIPWINASDARVSDGGIITKTKETINKLGLENSAAELLPKNTVCLSRSGSIGYVVILGKPMTTNQGFVNYICNEHLIPKYLQQLFIFERSSIISFGEGIAHKTVYFPEAKGFHILLPPRNEQKRIVSKIEELFSKIDSARQSLEQTKLQLELYRQSFFKSLFNKTTNFVTLEECAKIGSGGTPSRQKPEYYGGNISWVKTTEVQNSYIQSTSEKITELGLKNSSAKIYPKSSVIVAMYGEGKTRGKCAILNINASTNQACAVITCDNKKLLYKFCFYWFQSQYDQMRLKSSGGNQPNLNLGIIKKTKIPLPPLEEQKEIVSQIEQGFTLIENTSKIIESTLQKLQTMKMSVLKQAFEGKLVPQDPNDEPASVILEKIKSTKESQSTKQRGIKNVK
jgi:type I restriction enzyme, S subunit